MHFRLYRSTIKPLLDVLIAAVVLILSSPIFIVASLFLAVSLRGSPIFTQERGGLNNTRFFVYKFRTMTNERDQEGNLLPDHDRLTPIGGFVRKYSIDELPQLFNVLFQDMSLIGPRPLMSEYLDIYTERELTRHSVKPGITGWAQINGRNSISWKERFELDLYYVEHISPWLDARIVFQTILKVFAADSVNQSSNDTMEKYDGTN